MREMIGTQSAGAVDCRRRVALVLFGPTRQSRASPSRLWRLLSSFVFVGEGGRDGTEAASWVSWSL